MTDEFHVYRALRPIAWAGVNRHDRGDLVVDPPEFVPRKLGNKLERLDEDGRLPRDVLRRMHYNRLQQLASKGPIDSVDGNSKMGEIIDAYAIEENGEETDDED